MVPKPLKHTTSFTVSIDNQLADWLYLKKTQAFNISKLVEMALRKMRDEEERNAKTA